jgi:hypothetical protein
MMIYQKTAEGKIKTGSDIQNPFGVGNNYKKMCAQSSVLQLLLLPYAGIIQIRFKGSKNFKRVLLSVQANGLP